MGHPSQNPLIPANAGTRMAKPGLGSMSSASFQPTSTFGDLGPGIRRDERVF